MIKNFDLTDWTCFSNRRNSKNYVNADKTKMVKIITSINEKDFGEIEKEKEITDKAISIGIKTPKAYDLIECADGSKGLIYQYIEGKKSISRVAAEDFDNYDMYMKRFAKTAKEFHSTICPTDKFESMYERLKNNIINKQKFLTTEQMNKVLVYLDSIEKTNTCLHGDFQPSNFIITETEEFTIDLGSICYGNPLFDLGFYYFFVKYMPTFVTDNVFHCDKEHMMMMWNSFIKYYYDIKDEKGISEINKKMDKMALLSFFNSFTVTVPGEEIAVVYRENFDKQFSD